jgi:hypothetical protein
MPNRRLRSRWEKQDKKDAKQKEERHGRKLRKGSEKRETWLLDDPYISVNTEQKQERLNLTNISSDTPQSAS